LSLVTIHHLLSTISSSLIYRASAICPPFTKGLDHDSCRFYFARFDLTVTEGKNLQKSNGLLGLLVAFYILQYHFGFAILGDNER